MTQGQLIADAIEQTDSLLSRFLPGFDDSNHTKTAPFLPNHVAWNLGHLAITMHLCIERMGKGAPPPEDFSDDDPSRTFRRSDVGYGSNPEPDPSKYPPMARCIEIFRNAVKRLAAVYRSADDQFLSHPVTWGNGSTTARDLGFRMVYHNGNHTGQITDLRRALGLPRVLG